ncbi:nitrilase-related carbon-nitrogen hydrolase [Pseudonocardia sp. MH-G8]|uniref:nitrilase-related carbon-nitrogen hydrolase n=1 Tax=Pseudonocardia sp. MH-G8 TaxID=1854588 RepID=UPI000BA0DFFE|nr:nitrilase-related carbon-nitrogen hydrolase [Pseudonocardia sp. MH-G8]OZM80174.1 carbon-nitrogen hydrolase [Pseudonocardia sp. MH-G8]
MGVVVAACQIPVHLGSGDSAPLVAAVREAAGRGARLVVLPELAVCGYVFRDAAEARAAAQDLDGPTVSLLRELSRELGLVLVCGFAELAPDGPVHNSAVLVEDGQVRACYRKAHLWDRETQLFRAGDEPPPVVRTALGRVAVMICYDLEFPEWVRLAAEAGAEIVAVPVNWPLLPRPAGEHALEVVKARAAAGTYRVHVVVADRCGRERGVDWVGGSLVCASTGYLLAGPATAPDAVATRAVLTAQLDPAVARDKSLGPFNDARGDRRPDRYADAGALRGSGKPHSGPAGS